MKNISVISFCCGLFLVLLSSNVFAANEAKLRFSSLGFIDQSRVLVLSSGDEIELKVTRPSEPYKIRMGKSRTVHLYAEGVNPSDEESEPLCSAKIPSNCKSANVLLVPLIEKKRYNAIVIDDAKMPSGGIYMMNATEEDLGLNLDGSEKMVKSKKILLYPFDFKTPQNKRVQIFQKKGDEWKKFYSTFWRLVPDRREIMVLYRRPGSRNIRIKGIADY